MRDPSWSRLDQPVTRGVLAGDAGSSLSQWDGLLRFNTVCNNPLRKRADPLDGSERGQAADGIGGAPREPRQPPDLAKP